MAGYCGADLCKLRPTGYPKHRLPRILALFRLFLMLVWCWNFWTGDKFKNSAMSNEFLVPGKPKYLGDHPRHITNHWNTWGKLDALVLEGRTELPFENGFVDAPTYWTDYMMGQHNRVMIGPGKIWLKISISVTSKNDWI